MFEIHKNNIPQDKIPAMNLSRMIRIFGDFNEALLFYPDLFTDKKKHRECLKGVREYYQKCYKPYESLYTRDFIISEFLSLHSGNNSPSF